MKFIILLIIVLFSSCSLFSQENDTKYDVKLHTKSTNVPDSTNLNIYPTPFCPVTDLKFNIKEKAMVNIKLYDAEMKYVSTLFEKEMDPGQYEIQWDARLLKSGVYYYELNAGDITNIRKILLVK